MKRIMLLFQDYFFFILYLQYNPRVLSDFRVTDNFAIRKIYLKVLHCI